MAKSEKTIGSFKALYLALFTATRMIRKINMAMPEKMARCTINVNIRNTIVTSDVCNTMIFRVGRGGFGLTHCSGKKDNSTVAKSVKKKDSIFIIV